MHPLQTTNQSHQAYWPRWMRALRHWGLDGVTAALLESAGPLSLLLAQGAHLGQPFLGKNAGGQIEALGQLLENPQETRRFATFLREEESA